MPAARALPTEDRERTSNALRWLGILCVVIALAGGAISLLNQVLTVEAPFSLRATNQLLIESDFGRLLTVRIVALLLLGVIFFQPVWRAVTTGARVRWAIVVVSLGLFLPFALNSHADAVRPGRAAAVANDFIHLLAASIWVGGLFALVITVLVWVRNLELEDRRNALVTIIPRFSSLAIISVILLSTSGLYSAWLQVGNLTALTATDYGQTLIVKLLLVGSMLVLGAIDLTILEPRLRRAAGSGKGFRRTLMAEGAFAIAVLLATGILTSLPTARGVLESESGRNVFHITEGDVHVSLYVSPGAVGSNRYTAVFDLSGNEEVPAASQVALRASTAGIVQGVHEILLEPTGRNRYEASGSELSVVGDWQLEVLLRRPNTNEWRVATAIEVRDEAPAQRAPGPSPRFVGTTGLIWVLIAVGSIPVIVLGLRHERDWLPITAGFILLAASAAGLATSLSMVGGIADDANPIPATASSISQGQALFLVNCAACHGTDASGTGPALELRNSPNADLTASHVENHTDQQLHAWIRNGIGGTQMAGFESRLTDDEIWNLVNYIRSLRS